MPAFEALDSHESAVLKSRDLDRPGNQAKLGPGVTLGGSDRSGEKMAMSHRFLIVLVFLAGVRPTAAVQAQAGAGVPKTTTAPRLTQDEINNLKLSHYEVERVEIKFQPFIITHDDQELVQLVYDTRKEAQARVDEINNEDRLDRLGVEGKQNKRVGIREVKRANTEFISAESLDRIAKLLGVKEKSRYEAVGKKTHCSEFVRDFAKELLGRNLPELEGRAGNQADQLKAAVASPDSKWRSLSFSDDPALAFKNAQDLANDGKLVIVAWKIPHPTATDSGHVAVVVPSRQEDGSLADATKWKMNVPYIAQAGDKVSDYISLGKGFGPDKKAAMEIYVLSP